MCDQQSLRSACAYARSDQSLCWLLEYSMNVKLLTEHHLEFLSLKRGCTGSSESTLDKMPHCWKSRVMAQIICSAIRCFLLSKTNSKNLDLSKDILDFRVILDRKIFILMLLKCYFSLDNIKKLKQYILRYTVGNSLTSSFTSHFIR